MEKTMKARVQHKHDIEANWLKATNFTPLASEIVVYDSDENYDYPRIKIGDGKTNINSLPFVTKDYAKISDIPTKPEDIGALPNSTVIPTVPTKISAFENDKGYLTQHQSLDAYAKTADLGALATKDSLTASDVGALPDTTKIPSALSDLTEDSTHRTVTDTEKNAWNGKANASDIPTKVSDLTNDKGYITSYTETDPTVPAWAKKSTKPSYSKSEVGLGNVDNVKQYSASNPPPYPVTSVNGKTGSVTLDIHGSYTIPSFWQSALNTAIATVKSLQNGKNCVTFAHFSDNHVRLGYSGALIAEAMKKCHIPFCFYNGDSISSGYIANEGIMISEEEAFENMISVIPDNQFCRSLGNHDGYWAVSASERHTYTREQNYELFMRKRATAQNKQFGDDGTYYYVEDLASKVRFIVLNTNGGSVDNAQIAWFRDTALKVDTGWAVVVFSHQPISNHYHAEISNAAAVRAIVTESGVELIGWFSGHIHRDRIYTGAATNTADDTEGTAMGFKQITITSDRTSIAYEDATKHNIAEDNQSHAIDFVTINRDTKTVNLTRLGIGNNRVYSYDNIILYSITNNLQNVVSNNSIQSVEAGNSYTANLTVLSGYENLTVTVTMGGVDITSTAYKNGVITIAEVTGDVVITASAEEAPEPVANIWQAPYKLNSRLNTSETDPGADGVFISAWYPVSQEQLSGDIVLRSNKDIFNHANLSSSGDYLRFYSSTTAGTALVSDIFSGSRFTRAYDAGTGIYSLTIKYAFFSAKASEIKYFRWCAKVSTSAITADYFNGCILTINQPIA